MDSAWCMTRGFTGGFSLHLPLGARYSVLPGQVVSGTWRLAAGHYHSGMTYQPFPSPDSTFCAALYALSAVGHVSVAGLSWGLAVRRAVRIVGMVALLLALTACGQTGPLYLPDAASPLTLDTVPAPVSVPQPIDSRPAF